MSSVWVEEGLPFLYDLLEEGVLSKKEVANIVSQRKKFEAKLLSPSCAATVERYVAFEIMNEAKIFEKHPTAFVSSYFSNYIEKIYQRFLRKNPGCLQKWQDYISFCCTRGRHKACLSGISQALKYLPLNEDLASFSADILSKKIGSFSQARNVLRNALGKIPNSAKLWKALLEVELVLLIVLEERKAALSQNSFTKSSFTVIRTILEATKSRVTPAEFEEIKKVAQKYSDFIPISKLLDF